MGQQLVKPAHACLVIQHAGTYLAPALERYVQAIVCTDPQPDGQGCTKCGPCQKVATNNYYDLITVPVSEPITKERIIALQNQFLYGALEQAGKKIYVLHQIERATPQAINALLLFLEEPPSQTYAILTTRNDQAVPATIVSRCMRWTLMRNEADWQQIAQQYKLKPDALAIAQGLYWCVDDAQRALADNSFNKVASVARGFVTPHADAAQIKNLYEQFRTLASNEVNAVINYLVSVLPITQKGAALELEQNLKANPIKSAMFWRLLRLCESK